MAGSSGQFLTSDGWRNPPETSLAIATDAKGNLRMVVSQTGRVLLEDCVTPPAMDDTYVRLALALEMLADHLRRHGNTTPQQRK